MLSKGYYAHLLALAAAAFQVIKHSDTPDRLRRMVLKFAREVKSELPPEAVREVEAAEAEAAIKAADYLRSGGKS